MKYTYQKPCEMWSEQLAASSQKDLTSAERALLEQHIASCPACTAARAAYQQMDSALVTMPLIEPYSIYEEQLPERDGMLSSALLAGSVKSTPVRQVERRRKTSTARAKPTRFSGDFQENAPVSRRVRFQHALTTFAAVLVVCGLIGSAMLLFSRHNSPGVGFVTNTGPLPLYAALSNGTVYAFRPDNGSILWRRQLDLGGQGAIGGPTVAHGIVYVGSFNGSLYALRVSDGTLLWQHSLGATPVHPIAGDDNQVIYVGAKATLYALRTGDGSELWHTTVGTAGILNTVTPITVTAGRIYGDDGRGLFALDSQDGHVLWQGKTFNGVALVIVGNKIFATVGTGEQIEVLRTSDGQVLHMLPVEGNLGFDQGKLYVANQESHTLYILHPNTEHIIGQSIMACPVSTSPEPLVVQNGLVYTSSVPSSPQGWVCAMNVGNGKQVWRWTNTGHAAEVASMIIANHHCYFLYTDSDFTQVQLYALNTGNGAKLWQYTFPSGFPYGGYFAIEGR